MDQGEKRLLLILQLKSISPYNQKIRVEIWLESLISWNMCLLNIKRSFISQIHKVKTFSVKHTVHLFVVTSGIIIRIILKLFKFKVFRRKLDFVELEKVLTIVSYFICLLFLVCLYLTLVFWRDQLHDTR